LKHVIDGESFYPWSDIKNGRYDYWEKKYGKITKKRLEELVAEGKIECRTVTPKNVLFTFRVFPEYGIMTALGKHKFKPKVPEGWFE